MRYSGRLGYVEQVEVRPGIMEEVVTERDALGEVRQRTEALTVGDSILPVYRTNTSVSVFAREVGGVNNADLRYVTLAGVRWTIASIVNDGPRLVLYFGEEYHGPTPTP